MRYRDGKPVWVVDSPQSATALDRADLGANSASGHYDEAWLQALLHNHPEIFPIRQIESEFGDLIPLCRELPLGSAGFLDNFFITRDGQLVLVEAKLWRNPEARRKVIAQALDYAAAVFRMSYTELECAVLRARQASKEPPESLARIAAGDSESFDEAEFADAVQRNLDRGRAVIAVVGDGIREGVVQLADLVQGHAGHRFVFALVELAVYETPATGVRLIVPSVLAQTKLIERGVVRIEGNIPADLRVIVEPASSPSKASSGGRMGIGEDEFFELLGQKDPRLPEVLKAFLAKAEAALGVYADLKGAMNLKHASPTGQPLNMGTIEKSGLIDTGFSKYFGRTSQGKTYNENLAKLIGGSVIDAKSEKYALRKEGKMPRLSDLLPQHEQAWLDAMEQYIRECLAAAPDDKTFKASA